MRNIKKIIAILIIVLNICANLIQTDAKVIENPISRDTYYTWLTTEYTGGSYQVFQIKEAIEETIQVYGENRAEYHYMTAAKAGAKDGKPHTYHRTIALQISRVRDDVINPLQNPYISNKDVNVNGGSDPHYYFEVTEEMQSGTSKVAFDDEWEYYTYNGKKYSRQYFTVLLNKSGSLAGVYDTNEDQINSHGQRVNDWVIPYDTLWENIKYASNCQGWYENLQERIANGDGYAFCVDAVKTRNDWKPGSGDHLNAASKGAYLNGKGYYYYMDYYNPQGGTPVVWTWANWNTKPRSNGRGITSSMLKDYYNKYFYSGQIKDEDPIPVEEPKKTSGKFNLTKNNKDEKKTYTGNTTGANTNTTQSQNTYASPGIFTYNDSSEYELGKAIPTSNSYKNGVILDGWYGNIEISENTYVRTEKTTNYKVEYTYYTTHTEKEEIGVDEDGNVEYEEKEVTDTHTGTAYPNSSEAISSSWTGVYTTISNVDLYEVKSASATNGSSGTDIFTDEVLTHVPYSITINGTRYQSGSVKDGSADARVTSFVENVGYHAKNNSYDTSMITVSVNLGYNSSNVRDNAIKTAAGQVQYIWNQRIKNNKNLVTLQNDELMIDGVTYLTNPANVNQNSAGAWVKGGNVNWTYEKDKIHEMTETVSSNIAQAEHEVSIPSHIMNGYYYTDVSATYHSFITPVIKDVTINVTDNLGDNTTGSVHDEFNDTAKPAIIRTGNISYAYAKSNFDYTINEPIVVHTPVIAPISISNGEKSTQLIDKSGMSLPQLILDGTYTVNFDWKAYFTDIKKYKGYEIPAGWTKYIEEKYVAFPFSVKVNGQYYDLLGDGYTDWIPVGNTTTAFDIYIPSWSQEGLYYDPSKLNFTTYNAYARPIKVMVYAENVADGLYDYEQVEYNGEKKNYVATFTYPCQVSGILYDFQAVSVYDSAGFATSEWVDESGLDIFNFVKESERTGKLVAEKNVGKYNRLGLAYMRYTLDGDMTAAWDFANTLPFNSGKNKNGSDNGYLVKGSTIGFSVKTIANLTEKDSHVVINPSYRFYGDDGSFYDSNQLDVYYKVGNNSYVKMDSVTDLAHKKSSYLLKDFGAVWFEKSFYNYYYDTFNSTAKHKADLWADSHINISYINNGGTKDSYCLGEITLEQGSALWTGNEEELKVNLEDINDASSAKRYIDSYNYWGSASNVIADLAFKEGQNYINKGSNIVYADYWSFESSMQTWYGKYTIPSTLKVCPKGALEDWIDDNGSVNGTEDFWLEDGDLILNFDIKTYMDLTNEHLQYYGPVNSTDMWSKEKRGESGSNPDGPKDRPGDVGKIDLRKQSVADHWKNGLLYLN